MSHKIDEDLRRFNDVLRGKVRKNLRKYVSQGENIVKKYKDEEGNIREKVLAPMPRLDTPRFKFNDKQGGGVGQGSGDEGDPLSGEEGDGQGQAGNESGEHEIEEFTMEEIVDMIIEECELPDLTEKGKKFIIDTKPIFRGIQRHGPRGLLHKRRTLKKTIVRQISEGTYDLQKPVLIPETEDFVYKGPKPKIIEGMQAVIIYMMDYSGSMGTEQKEMARALAFWLSRCVKRFYKGIEERYIIHDTLAKEVDRDAFFTTTSNGGTEISSAFRLALQIVDNDYPLSDWNIYFFHFSDGDNFDSDNAGCVNLLRQRILSGIVNMFGYAQVYSPHATGRFKNILEGNFSGEMKEKIRITELKTTDDTMVAIRKLLGKKK